MIRFVRKLWGLRRFFFGDEGGEVVVLLAEVFWCLVC